MSRCRKALRVEGLSAARVNPGLVSQLCSLRRRCNGEGLVEREDETGSDRELLLNVSLEPHDGSSTDADGCSDSGADRAANECACSGGGTGREAEGSESRFRVIGADHCAFRVDAGIGEVVEIDELRVDAVRGAVGEGDEIGLQPNGGASGEAASAMDCSDAATNLRADGDENYAVLGDGLHEFGKEGVANFGVLRGERVLQARPERGAFVDLARNVGDGGDDVGVRVGGGRQQAPA